MFWDALWVLLLLRECAGSGVFVVVVMVFVEMTVVAHLWFTSSEAGLDF